MRLPLVKTACLPLFLLVSCLLSSAVMAAGTYDGVKSDIQAGRTEIALGTLQGIIKQQPDDYQAWFLIGVAHARQQQFHQAIEAFRYVIEINSVLAEPHNNLAVIYNELGDVRAAVNELEQSLKKRPDYAIVEENIADLYVKLALENYRNALDKEPRAGLEKRYLRLLQVRNPTTISDHLPGFSEKTVRVVPPVLERNVADREVETAMKQPALIHAGQSEQLPELVPAAVAKVESLPIESDGSVKIKPLEKEVLDAVEMWRAAWSSRDLADYFFAYAEDFQVPERFDSFEHWQRYKQRVIGSKTYIQVELSDVQVEIDQGNRKANVKFLQKFSSNSYNGSDLKVLEMRRENGVWKIVSEVSIA